MSKQSEAKQAQGYEENPDIHICAKCKYYKTPYHTNGYGWLEEKQICSLGRFAVKKMATCKLYEKKDQ